MINTIIPLANWGMGTAIIIVFVVVSGALTVLVINFWVSGKKKKEED